MESIDRENEFSKLNLVDGCLITGAKKWFLKLGYNYSYYGSYIEKVNLKVPVQSIKKMRIVSMGIVSIVFFSLAAMSFGFGFIRFRDDATGEMGPGHVTTGIIFCMLFLACGFLYLRSKMGRLKVLQTSFGGNMPVLLYASMDIGELKSLREIIKNQKPASDHKPPPM